MRIGIGYDSHRLLEGRKLIIGGVRIDYHKGLLGHSDADVLVHAVVDAILGAAGLGDIGTHFPDTEERWKGVSSLIILDETIKKIALSGLEVQWIDSIIIAQEPKMMPHILEMKLNISTISGIDISRINIKAKSNEGMGFIGRGEGIAAQAVCILVER